jgi:protein TonB
MLNVTDLYKSEWLALVFKNRNQNYGAYLLRQQSDVIITKALFIASAVFVASFVGPMLFSKSEDVVATNNVEHFVETSDIIHEMKPPEKVKPVEHAGGGSKSLQSQVNFNDHVKVVNETTDQPVKASALKNAAISSTNFDGADDVGNSVGTIDGTGAGIDGIGKGSGKGNGDEILPAMGVSVFPEFPGGMDALAKFIEKNLRYPITAQEAGVNGKVFLSFVVEKDGTINLIKVEKGIGYGCDEEAMRVIKKMPRWKPGFQNDKPVRVRYNIPINYRME